MKGTRRTITFKDWIYKEINKRRGKILIEDDEDVSFTEMVNYLLEQLFELEKRGAR